MVALKEGSRLVSLPITSKPEGILGTILFQLGFWDNLNLLFRSCNGFRWEVNTCGYHGEDGLIYLGKRQGEAFGPSYKTGDTVGAGINYDSQEFFFT